MPIPDFQAVMHPLLDAVKDGQVHDFKVVVEQLKAHFNLTPEERQEKIASGKQTVIKNRSAWARTYLTKAGLLESPGRGQTKITPRGLEALAQTEQPIRVRYLKQFPEFADFHAAKPKADTQNSGASGSDVDADSQTTPEERIEAAHAEFNQALIEEVLDTVKSGSPEFFEQLVVDLMISMGYGGSRKEAGQATQYTADGGIDGIIKEDPLGLELIYLQAKRYSEGTVGRPEVQRFAGALDMQRAKKGVFITTSRFSSDAKDFVSVIEKRIILIDGLELANLMVSHGLGVSVKHTYQIKQIDTDYFGED